MEIKDLLELFMELIPAFVLKPVTSPEFGLYMPNLGGSVYMAISTPSNITWIKDMEFIESRFKSGQRTYIVRDRRHLGNGSLTIDAVAMSDGDGLVVRYKAKDIPAGTKILWIYGGSQQSEIRT